MSRSRLRSLFLVYFSLFRVCATMKSQLRSWNIEKRAATIRLWRIAFSFLALLASALAFFFTLLAARRYSLAIAFLSATSQLATILADMTKFPRKQIAIPTRCSPDNLWSIEDRGTDRSSPSRNGRRNVSCRDGGRDISWSFRGGAPSLFAQAEGYEVG